MTFQEYENIIQVVQEIKNKGSANMDELLVVARVKHYVKNYLKNTGKRQCFLAKEIGFEPKKFSSLINGRVAMSITDLTKICAYFKEPASTFIILEDSVA